jgi:Family of unknown function (DUF6941)
MKVTLLLADSAQAVNGKLYVLGGGWSITGPAPSPMALAIKIDLPWDRANMKHRWKLELVDSDNRPVKTQIQPDAEPEPFVIEGEFETGRPPGLKPGTPLDVPLAFNFGPIALQPGMRYEWRFSFAKYKEETWSVAFSTRSELPPGYSFPGLMPES